MEVTSPLLWEVKISVLAKRFEEGTVGYNSFSSPSVNPTYIAVCLCREWLTALIKVTFVILSCIQFCVLCHIIQGDDRHKQATGPPLSRVETWNPFQCKRSEKKNRTSFPKHEVTYSCCVIFALVFCESWWQKEQLGNKKWMFKLFAQWVKAIAVDRCN